MVNIDSAEEAFSQIDQRQEAVYVLEIHLTV